MTKSAWALKFTLRRFESAPCYLWTFTFADVLPYREAARRWSRFCRLVLVRGFGVQGVRVFELHPGGHGLHVHCITRVGLRRAQVRAIWAAVSGFGLGRWDIARVAGESALYALKYVQKGSRSPGLGGVRLWATFGGFAGCRARDVSRDTPESRFARKAYAALVEGAMLTHKERRRMAWVCYKLAWRACNTFGGLGVKGGAIVFDRKDSGYVDQNWRTESDAARHRVAVETLGFGHSACMGVSGDESRGCGVLPDGRRGKPVASFPFGCLAPGARGALWRLGLSVVGEGEARSVVVA